MNISSASISDRPAACPELNHRDLLHNASAHVQNYQLSARQNRKSPILLGHLATEQLQEGLQLHRVDATIAQPFGFEAELEPCLKVSVVLRGDTRLTYGDRTLQMGPGFGRREGPGASVASVIALNEKEGCSQQAQEGDIRRSLTLSLSPLWLERQGLASDEVARFSAAHLNTLEWQLPKSLHLLADQLFDYTGNDPASRLVREGFALSLAGGLVSRINGGADEIARQCGDSRRGHRLLALLESGEADLLSMAQIGDRLGMSAATLQRHARNTLGMSLNRYLRTRRLEKAYRALAAQEMGIADAALLAGYGHAANFTTAFRRQFGICPTELNGH